MSPNRWFSGLIAPWLLIMTLMLAVGGILCFLLILNWSRPPRAPVGVVTAALTIIPAPTITQTSTPTQEIPTQNPGEIPTPPDDELGIGIFVKISGTGGAGLRLRSQPGLVYEPRFLGVEDEIFQIEDGPQESDGYIWWYLVAPFDSSRNGWAVSNYFTVVQGQ